MLTAQDIQSQQFHVRFRGFDIDEVDAFLEKAATTLQTALDENHRLTEQLKELEKELAGYKRQQQSFQNAIMAAQGIADQMKEKSSREAEEILAAARMEAGRLQDEANGEVTALERELDRLRALKGQVQEELRQQLTSYLEMLEPQPFPVAGAEKNPPPDPWVAAAIPTGEAPQESEEAGAGDQGEEDDLSDLYTRIDLPDDAMLEAGSHGEDLFGASAVESADSGPLLTGADEEEESAPVPDLDGDMIFTLEDPLEDEEPVISLVDEETEEEEGQSGKKKDLFSPDESPL